MGTQAKFFSDSTSEKNASAFQRPSRASGAVGAGRRILHLKTSFTPEDLLSQRLENNFLILPGLNEGKFLIHNIFLFNHMNTWKV